MWEDMIYQHRRAPGSDTNSLISDGAQNNLRSWAVVTDSSGPYKIEEKEGASHLSEIGKIQLNS
jgi:hypothetical protein